MATSIATFQAILKFCATKNLFKKTTLQKKLIKKLKNYGKGLECLQTLKTGKLNQQKDKVLCKSYFL